MLATNLARLAFALALAAPVWAHVISMSNGDIRVEGNRARYELRMPLYEIAHVRAPQRTLLESIHFGTAGKPARLVESSCRENELEGAYNCTATYEFPVPVENLDVECTFHSVTVPNHVHLLRASKDGKQDSALFDFSFPKTTMRFVPPTIAEIAVTQIGAGLWRAMGGLAQVLFLACLVLAARSRRELFALTTTFLAGQVAGAVLTPLTGWQPAVRFAEAAAALTIAYLAVEILLLPSAGQRWLIAGILGVFHGLYFDVFLQTTEYKPAFVLTGAAIAEVALVVLFAFVFSRIRRVAEKLKPVQVSASILFAIGLVWFFLRLRS